MPENIKDDYTTYMIWSFAEMFVKTKQLWDFRASHP